MFTEFISDDQRIILDKINKMREKYPLLKEGHIYFIPTPIRAVVDAKSGVLGYDRRSGMIAFLHEIGEDGCVFYKLYYDDHNCTFYTDVQYKTYNKKDGFFVSYDALGKAYSGIRDITDDVPFKDTTEYDKVKALNLAIESKYNLVSYLFLFLLIAVLPVNGVLMAKYWKAIYTSPLSNYFKAALLLSWIISIAVELYFFSADMALGLNNNDDEEKSMRNAIVKIISKKEYNNIEKIEKENLETYRTFIDKYNAAEFILYNDFAIPENIEYYSENRTA